MAIKTIEIDDIPIEAIRAAMRINIPMSLCASPEHYWEVFLTEVICSWPEAAPAVESEPTAWLIESGSSDGDEDIVTLNHGVVRRFKRAGHNSTPLYTHRQPSLAEKIERIRALKDKYKGPSTRFAEGGYFMLIEVLSILEDKP